MSITQRFVRLSKFAPTLYPPLRKHFEQAYKDVRSTNSQRFCWDYWHVPGQYTQLRTPAWEYFPKDLYEKFHTRLVMWGRKHLGCHDISAPWLSNYIEGCEQKLHSDVPHGPWAFVYSLAPQRSIFEGGNTLLLRDSTLNHWSHPLGSQSFHEENEILQSIAPTAGQLLVFDPRIPHGVSRLSGTQDPRQGRLVIHGWFVNPRPFFTGAVSRAIAQDGVQEISNFVGDALSAKFSSTTLQGYMCLRLKFAASGILSKPQLVCSTLVSREGLRLQTRDLIGVLKKLPSSVIFAKSRTTGELTLPLIFESL